LSECRGSIEIARLDGRTDRSQAQGEQKLFHRESPTTLDDGAFSHEAVRPRNPMI
jgi:hypothetical protein